MTIEKIQQYWLAYMYSQKDIKKMFVTVPDFNMELYFTRENDVVRLKTIHI